MAAKLTRLTRKVAIQVHVVADSCTILVPAPGGHSGKFWIRPPIAVQSHNIFLARR